MIDGVIPSVVGSGGIALGNWPCQWTVTFDKVYLLREIRLKIPEGNGSYQHYVVTTSVDGRTFVPLRDHSKTPSFGWQRILFLSRPVKAITLQGLFHSLDSTFYATELEAYCATPTSVIEAAEPAEGEDAGEAGPVPSEPR